MSYLPDCSASLTLALCVYVMTTKAVAETACASKSVGTGFGPKRGLTFGHVFVNAGKFKFE
jgi:hypothetical protein